MPTDTLFTSFFSLATFLTDEHRRLLKSFWLLQYLRTEEKARRALERTGLLASIARLDDPGFRLQIRDVVQVAMQAFAENMEIVSDLKVCLVRNQSKVPFVTSDDPAVLTNRWHLQNAKRNAFSFGLHSAGALAILPLSPSVLCLAYDSDMHSVSHHRGWIDIRKGADADAFNQHQYLNGRANIFIQDTEHFEVIREAFRRVSTLRPPTRYKMNYAIPDETSGERDRFVVVDPEKAEPHRKALISSQEVYASPTAWPWQIRWRSGAFAFSNGTGVGYVRRAFTKQGSSRPFKKIKASPA